jgi:hypothetical protein
VSISTGFAHAMYLDSVRLGERDITMDEFEIAPGLVPFRVLLKTGSGRVSGTVHDGVGGIIVLVPKPSGCWRSSWPFPYSAAAASRWKTCIRVITMRASSWEEITLDGDGS